MKRRILSSKGYHDVVADVYDNNPYLDKLASDIEDEMSIRNLSRIMPHLRSGKILDVGGGTGRWSEFFCERGYQVVLIDNSSRMIKVAKQKLAGFVKTRKLRIINADVCRVSRLQLGTFALAYAQGDVLSYVPDASKALRSLAKVVSRGGYLVLSVDNLLYSIGTHLMDLRFGALRDIIQGHEIITKYHAGNEYLNTHLFCPNELKMSLERLDFEVISTIGKPIFAQYLSDEPMSSRQRRSLIRYEWEYSHLPFYWGQAKHLEIVARKRK